MKCSISFSVLTVATEIHRNDFYGACIHLGLQPLNRSKKGLCIHIFRLWNIKMWKEFMKNWLFFDMYLHKQACWQEIILTLLMTYLQLNFTIFLQQFLKFVKFYFSTTYQIHHLRMVVGPLWPFPVFYHLAGMGQFLPPVGHCVPAAYCWGWGFSICAGVLFLIILFVVHRLIWIHFCNLLPILALLHAMGCGSLPFGSFLSIGWCGPVFAPCCPFWPCCMSPGLGL